MKKIIINNINSVKVKILKFFLPIIIYLLPCSYGSAQNGNVQQLQILNQLISKIDKSEVQVSDREVILRTIKEVYKEFANSKMKNGVSIQKNTAWGEKTFYGFHEDYIKVEKEYGNLKKEIFKKMKLQETPFFKTLEIVGDSRQFQLEQSDFLKKILKQLCKKYQCIIYGYTGYRGDDENEYIKKYDINSALNANIDDNPSLAEKVIGNVVGHSVQVIENYKCTGSKYVNHFILVYNNSTNHSNEKNNNKNDNKKVVMSSRFGSDMNISDYFPDHLFMAAGGIQSFAQAVNCLRRDILIIALDGLRQQGGNRFFCAAKFLAMTKEAVIANENIDGNEINNLLEKHTSDKSLYSKNRADSGTKAGLFDSSWKAFIKEELYKKLPVLFHAHQWVKPKEGGKDFITIQESEYKKINNIEEFASIREKLKKYGIDRFYQEMMMKGIVGIKDILPAEEPFNAFARILSGNLKPPYSLDLLEKSGLAQYSKEFIICKNKLELDKKWDSPVYNKKNPGEASMSKHHLFVVPRNLARRNVNVLTLGINKKTLQEDLIMLEKMEHIGKEYAKEQGWGDKVGLFFHCFPFKSVNTLHLNVVDLNNTGPSFDVQKYKNLQLNNVKEQLNKELKFDTIYIGAGGGGDTAIAALLASSDKNKSSAAIGAGNSFQAYQQYLSNRGINDNEAIKQTISKRNGFKTKEAAKEYIEKILELSEEKPNEQILFKLKHTFSNNKQYQNSIGESNYNALIEEGITASLLNVSMYMMYSIGGTKAQYITLDGKSMKQKNLIPEFKKSREGLKRFIKDKGVKKVVLVDIGGDIVNNIGSKNITEYGRDEWVFLNALWLKSQDQNLQLAINVYGPGCDGHEAPDKVHKKLMNFGFKLNNNLGKALYQSLKKNKLRIEKIPNFFTKQNRAARIFYNVFQLFEPNKNNDDEKVDDKDDLKSTIVSGLQGRKEKGFKPSSDEITETMSQSYSLSVRNPQAFISKLGVESIMQ